MSGVIAKADSTRSERAQVLIKGAPYEVTQLADPDSLPQDWAQARQTMLMLTVSFASSLSRTVFVHSRFSAITKVQHLV